MYILIDLTFYKHYRSFWFTSFQLHWQKLLQYFVLAVCFFFFVVVVVVVVFVLFCFFKCSDINLYSVIIMMKLILKFLQTAMISYNLKPLSGGGLFRPIQDVFRASTDAARAAFRAFNPLTYLGGAGLLGPQGR